MFVCLCHVRDIIVFAETETLSPKTFPSAARDISQAHVKVFQLSSVGDSVGRGSAVSVPGRGGGRDTE